VFDGEGNLMPLPEENLIPIGEMTIDFEVVAVDDGVEEADEVIGFTVSHPLACDGEGVETEHSILLIDEPEAFNVDGYETTACAGLPIELSPIVSGGYGNYTYDWFFDGSSNASYWFVSDTSDVAVVTVGDTCGVESVAAAIEVEVLTFPELTVSLPSSPAVIPCNGTAEVVAASTGGDGVYAYLWANELGEDGRETVNSGKVNTSTSIAAATDSTPHVSPTVTTATSLVSLTNQYEALLEPSKNQSYV
jgi:hypothetical protein